MVFQEGKIRVDRVRYSHFEGILVKGKEPRCGRNPPTLLLLPDNHSSPSFIDKSSLRKNDVSSLPKIQSERAI